MRRESNSWPCGGADSCFLCHRLSEVWPEMKERSFEVEYGPDRMVFGGGEPPNRLVIVCEGVVVLFSPLSNGNIRVHWIARAGQVLGLAAVLLNKPYAFSAKTLELSRLRFIKRSHFLAELDAEPQLWKTVALESAGRRYQTLEEGKKDSLVRLVELLLSVCRPSPASATGQKTYRARMTTQQMADAVGISDRQVRTHLARLKGLGLVVRERGWLEVVELQGLINLLEKIQRGELSRRARRK